MNYRFMVVHLVLMFLAYNIFLRLTTPSPSIQPALHGVFGIAVIASLVLPYWLVKKGTLQGRDLAVRFLALTMFGSLWSGGIMVATRLLSARVAATTGAEAALFYGSSGTQFFTFKDAAGCWLLLIPAAFVYLLSHWSGKRIT